MKKFKGLIFDMDGTLVENMTYHLRAFDVQAERHGYQLLEKITSRFFGWSNHNIMPIVIPAEVRKQFGVQYLSDEKEAIYREIYSGHVKLTAGLDALLADAAAHGVKCAVGSAGPRENVEFILREGNLLDRIVAYTCADDVKNCKPDPEIFLTICAKIGISPSDCIVFEDAPSGIKASVAAGCKTVGLTTTERPETLLDAGADMVVCDFTTLTINLLNEKLG